VAAGAGRTFLEVAEVLAFARRTVERRQGGGLDGAASRSAEGEGFPFSLEAWSTAPPEPDKASSAWGSGALNQAITASLGNLPVVPS
jgi:hypothetical protein